MSLSIGRDFTPETKREQHSKILHQFSVEILYSMRILLFEILTDVKASRRLICRRQSKIIVKAQRRQKFQRLVYKNENLSFNTNCENIKL